MIANVVVWMLPICTILLLVTVREKPDFVPPKIAILPGLKVMWANAPFRRLLFAYIACTTGSALGSPVVVLFFDHVIGDPTVTPMVLMGYFVASLAGVPLWVWLAGKTDKTPYLADCPERSRADLSRLHAPGRGGRSARRRASCSWWESPPTLPLCRCP